MGVVLKCSNRLSTLTKAETLAFAKGVDFLFKLLQNGKGKNSVNHEKYITGQLYFY